MPVDPGNLLLLGHVGERVVLGLPGCARSPKVNGFDWVLERLVAGLPVGPAEIMRMGAGGLLAEIPTRPLPRAEAKAPSARAERANAAGAADRRRCCSPPASRGGWAGPNKLLAEIPGSSPGRRADGGAGGAALAGVARAADHRRARQPRRRDRRRTRPIAGRAGAQPRFRRGSVDLA